jgi:hypothetical protein
MGNGNKDFGLEIARLLPVVIREVTSGKNTVFSGSNITVNQMRKAFQVWGKSRKL